MATTLAQLEDIFYGILREEGPTTAYPQVLADLYLNGAQQDICAGRVIHPFTKEEARKGVLHFLNSDAYYSNVKTTGLTSDTSIGATSISADTTDYPASGALYIGGQVITYTSKTATTFDGVTGILFPYVGGTQISIAFAVPTDYRDIINVIYKNKLKLPPRQYDDIFENLNSVKGSTLQRSISSSLLEGQFRVSPFYTIKDSSYLIMGNLNETGQPIHMRYEKAAPNMSSTVDCIIDDDIKAQMTIPFLAVANMLFSRGEEQRAGEIYNFAIAEVRKLYSFYNDISFENQNNTHYKMGKGRINI